MTMVKLFQKKQDDPIQEVSAEPPPPLELQQPLPAPAQMLDIDILPDDPILAHILKSPEVIEVDRLRLASPALEELRQAGVKLVVPLVSQGELIGLIHIGSRRSEQDYSSDDRRLLNTLSTQAAPALRVAQLARQQQIEARQRERMENELRVARVIQQTLLPKEIPQIQGYALAAHWQPALAVSGDFYDFIPFPDGKLAIIAGDVTDKGVPAALVMATTRSILRSAAERLVYPGAVLEQANNMLCPDIPPNMFVTCLYALLDPSTGIIRYANAGHNLPFQRTLQGVTEMRVRGMPLGLMPEMIYEEKETGIAVGENIVLYSDGLVEAHNPQGEMFGFPRLRELLVIPECGQALIACLMNELNDFTGPGWEQEDDITFVTIERLPLLPVETEAGQILAEFDVPSQPGNELEAMKRVVQAVQPLNLPIDRLERLKTAVAEGTMNAMEHGNRYQIDLPVIVRVILTDDALRVKITDRGGGRPIHEAETPNLEAKLEGLQSPRGWGLFLIKNMVDDMNITNDDIYHTIELVFYLQEDRHAT